MRKLLLAGAAGAALFTTGLVAPSAANAMPLAPIASPSLVDNVTYWCRPVWRCGPYGCGYTRVCGWRPGPYYGPYAFARPYWGGHHWGGHHWGGHRWGHHHRW